MPIHLLQDMAIVMATAGAMTLICHRLQQPVVIGYLLAGLLIGPYTPPVPLVHNLDSIHTMAELGLVFLLFSLGLEFNLPKIRKVGLSAGLAAVLEVVLMLTIGYYLGQWFGWNKMDSIFLGAILSISSTTIIVKVFMDFKMMQEKFVQVVFGILVLEDIVAIAILSILSGLGAQGGPDTSTIFFSLARIGLFVTLFLVLGLLLVPRLMHWVAGFKSKEVLGIVTLGLCLGGAMIAYKFDLSIALGAFLIGAVLAASQEIKEIEEWINPVRDMFSAIFFVSAGMLIQPQLLWEYKFPIIVVTLVTLVGKVLSGTAGSFLAGYDMKTSTRIGMSLAQIGEFSFVIASLGLTLKVTSDFLYPLAIMVSSLTTLATPYLIKNSDRLVDTMERITPPFIMKGLNSYQTWVGKLAADTGQSKGTAIFSRYLVRMGVYIAILVAVIAIVQAFSMILIQSYGESGDPFIPLLWLLTGLLCLPLFEAIAKYANHIILLLVTRSKTILRFINVHMFYNTLNAITLAVLQISLVLSSMSYIADSRVIAGLVVLMPLCNYLFRRRISRSKEWLESVLDQVIGLATSEPTRQAMVQSGDSTLMLNDIMDQITLPQNSFAHHKSIRDIKLREETGATIIAIYRQGTHIANPGPDTQLLPDDVLVILGDEQELGKARKLLKP